MYLVKAEWVCSGVSCWMFEMWALAVFQTCSVGLWSGGAGREVDRFDPLQCLSGLVQVGHRLGVVESRIIENNGYLIVLCFAHKAGHGQGYLFGVLVALDGVDLHLLGRQAQGAEE